LRLDRLITLALPRRSKGADRLPVLMYHSISDEPEPGVSSYYKVRTSPQRFAEQMQWLADWGYRGVTLSEGLAALKTASGPQVSGFSSQVSPKLVALTFDDGFQDFHTAAFPVLQRHGFSATMYLPTAFIGDERRSFKDRTCLTWTEVKQLEAAGIEFGSHTVNHPELVKLAWPAIETELRDSKATLEQKLGLPVRSFAYPFAFPSTDRVFTARFQQALRTTGYGTCATTEIGTVQPGDGLLQLKRLPANEDDDAALLQAKLAGAYDWMHGPQSLVKRLKSLG